MVADDTAADRGHGFRAESLQGSHDQRRQPSTGAVRVPRSLDAAGRASADRLLRSLLLALCALLAVLLVRDVTVLYGKVWQHWRLWAVFLPVGMLLMPQSSHGCIGRAQLAGVLDAIGTALRLAGLILCLGLLLWLAGEPVLSPGVALLLFCVQFLMFQLVWGMVCRVSRRWHRPPRVVIIGADAQGLALAQHVMANAAHVDIVGFVDDRRSRVDASALPAPLLGTVAEFMQQDRDIDSLVIALPQNAGDRIDTLSAMLRNGLYSIYLAPEAPVLRRTVVGRHPRGLETLIPLGLDRLPLNGRILKRLFDIVFASLALLLFLPFGLVIAALIKRESPGPVIFRQRRYGLGNKMFDLYKFRSMRFDPAPAVGELRLTERGDSRVTRVGDFLRRTSLDEFPQFFNVLLGDMSVVGPRPHPPGVKAGARFYEDVVVDFMERYKVRPGITGWAQVNGLRGNTFTEGHLTHRFAFDIQYLRNWSFELDLWIVIKTILGGFGGRNAF